MVLFPQRFATTARPCPVQGCHFPATSAQAVPSSWNVLPSNAGLVTHLDYEIIITAGNAFSRAVDSSHLPAASAPALASLGSTP